MEIDFDAVRDACLECCSFFPEYFKREALAAWGLSGLQAAQWEHVSEVAVEKYGWFKGRRERRDDDPFVMPPVTWLKPEDAELDRDEVWEIWKKHESAFIEPMERFEGSLTKMIIVAGKAYEKAILSISAETNGDILLASHGRKTSIALPDNSTTFHAAAIYGVFEVLKAACVLTEMGDLWPEDGLQKWVESRWKLKWDDHLCHFLSLQGWMMDLDKLPDMNAEGVAKEIQLEWAAAKKWAAADLAKTGSKAEWSSADTPARWARVFQVSAKTFKRRVEDGKIRAKKLSDRSYQIDARDLPSE